MPKELTPLEKLQLLVPGYRGYKAKDLIRQDDFLVRQATIMKLETAINNLANSESQIVRSQPFSPLLRNIEDTISEIRTLIGMLNSTQGGGADIYAGYKIHTEQLDEIYKNDLQMVSIADQILTLSNFPDQISQIRTLLATLKTVLLNRAKLFLPPEVR
jgi:Mg2+ and Co2+ transporter CorA